MAGQRRRCVSCGRSEAKGLLLRFVCGEKGFEWDALHVKPGRGGYVHPQVRCWSRMSEVNRWRFALRCGEELTREGLVAAMEAVRDRIEGLNPETETASSKERGRRVRF